MAQAGSRRLKLTAAAVAKARLATQPERAERPPQPGGQSVCQRTLNEFRSTRESRPSVPSFLSSPTTSSSMSDNQPGYRVEYASSSRSKCKGASLRPFTPINNDVCPRCLPAPRPKTMHRCHIFPLLIYITHHVIFRVGTAIGKGDLRFGTLVDFRGAKTL